MREILAVFSSSNIAVQMKKYLYDNYNINSVIIPTPKELSLSGCGFCIKTDYQNIDTIKEVIKSLKINSKGIFDQTSYEKIF